MKDWIIPDWPAPPRVRARVTTRQGGLSTGPYASLNLGDHVGDRPEVVNGNRQILEDALGCTPVWLKQVHGTRVITAESGLMDPEADAAVGRQPGIACAIMSADCLPVLFCDRGGSVVAAAHAGWRGLCAGVLENTVRSMSVAPEDILAWLGPAIGPNAFEVGPEVRQAFVERAGEAADAFSPGKDGKFLADIYLLARQRLEAVAVGHISGGGFCTVSDRERFFSYRRDGVTGRMASLVWLAR